MINGLTRTDYIVVTGRAAGNDTGMIIGSGGKCARGMAKLAILGGRHVVDRFTARRDAMAGIAARGQHGRVGVIDGECGGETVGVVATSAIGGGCQVRGHRGRLGGSVNAIGFIVARFAGLHRWINHAVVEYAAHIETRDTMAGNAIDRR